MKTTSIHLRACNAASSQIHNKREKDLDYVRKDLTPLNESFSYIGDKNLQTIEAEIRKEVKAKTGRKLYKNAIPIKEGVVVIDQNTSMSDLKAFCEACRQKWGIIPLEIHTHKDEGYMDSQTWKPNLHAHITWRMYNENGRNVRLQREDMAEMQDLAALHLHMKRGKKSSKKHLTSIEYKIKIEEYKLKEAVEKSTLAEAYLSDVVEEHIAEIKKFYCDSEELGLTCRQANHLRKNGELTLPGVILPDGTTIQRNDPQEPNITLRYGTYIPDGESRPTKGIHINLHYHRDWKSVKTWIREALRSAWFIINGIPNNRRNSQRMGY